MDLIGIIEQTAKEYPDRIALRSSANEEGITYSELDEYTGRIAGALKDRGIGKDDVVMVVLPRDIHSVAAALAVWKAGACVTLAEDTYAKERIQFIQKDCGAKLVLDLPMLMEMPEHDPLSGHVIPDDHDACFIVYTSGSTGNPKGVIHEYGKIGLAVAALTKNALATPAGSLFAMTAPLNFLASYLTVFYIFSQGKCAYVLSYAAVKNPPLLLKVMEEKQAAEIFMTPTFLKACLRAWPSLTNFFIGGEACVNTWLPVSRLINTYASSESGMPVTTYVVTAPEEKTPVGRPLPEDLMCILDENGKPVKPGEKGEICIKNLFTRGYLNLPEKNAEIFRDGLCHMGDIGYIREDGNLMFSGRKDDMIKINGNRVEPAETEAVLKKVLGLTNAVVKGFTEEKRSYLCAYFLRKEAAEKGIADEGGVADAGLIREKLADHLPYYMIPTYYVCLDRYPVNANGKLARKELKAPGAGLSGQYEAPVSETEALFCDGFAKVLKLPKVGANDDFYLAGGDSAAAAALITKLDLPGLSISALYQCRTPRKLAAYYAEHAAEAFGRDEKNEAARKLSWPLNDEMAFMFGRCSIAADRSPWYLNHLVKIKEGIAPEKLTAAVNKVFRSHSSLNSVVSYDRDGSLKIRYAPEMIPEIPLLSGSEAELQKYKDQFTRVFPVLDHPLYEAGVIQTEAALYLFANFFHALIDGTSVGILLKEIAAFLADETFVPAKDYYYLFLSEEAKNKESAAYRTAAKHYADLYQRNITEPGILPYLRPDRATGKNACALFEAPLSLSRKEFMRRPIGHDYIGNGLFIMAFALALAAENGQDGAAVEWTYHGRNRAELSDQVGLYIRTPGVFLRFHENETLLELFTDIREQIDFGTAHCEVNSVTASGKPFGKAAAFLYQKDIYDLTASGIVSEEIDLMDVAASMYQYLEFEFIDSASEEFFSMELYYRADLYDEKTIRRFFERFDRIVDRITGEKDPGSIPVAEIIRK